MEIDGQDEGTSATDVQGLAGSYDLTFHIHELDPYWGSDWLIATSGIPSQLKPGGWIYLRTDGEKIVARVRARHTELRASRPERTGADTGDRGPGPVLVLDPETWEYVNFDLSDDEALYGSGYRYLLTDDEDGIQHYRTTNDPIELLGPRLVQLNANQGYGTVRVDAPSCIQFPETRENTERVGAKVDYEKQARQNKRLGENGEGFVVRTERNRLTNCGRPDLADRVEWVSQTQGDGLGYDVVSFDPETDNEVHIEVKTTAGPVNTAFFISRNELDYAEENPSQFRLYRVFDLDGHDGTKFYEVLPPLGENLHLRAAQFEARPK